MVIQADDNKVIRSAAECSVDPNRVTLADYESEGYGYGLDAIESTVPEHKITPVV